MAKPARQRESLHTGPSTTSTPSSPGPTSYVLRRRGPLLPAGQLEGGDVHVIGHGAVLIGMGERSTPMAIERWPTRCSPPGRRPRWWPSSSPTATPSCTRHGHVDGRHRHVRPLPVLRPPSAQLTITAGDEPGQLSVSRNHSLWETLAEILDVAEITVLTTDEDVRAAEREQWDDGTTTCGRPAWSSATSATWPPTPCCANTASR